jgi:hypothetical protein
MMAIFKRGNFGEIDWSSIPASTRALVEALVDGAANGKHVDEHGQWDFGADLDSKRRGRALNWDLYGFGKDIHNGTFLAVVQVREYAKACANWWPSVRKDYFLLGCNEDQTVFAHPVQAMVVRGAVNKGKDVVKATQDWLWGTDYSRVIRQGDMAFVPRKRRPSKGEPQEGPVLLRDSHELTADEVLVGANKKLYALNPRMEHLPGTHPEISMTGWALVATARRAPTWAFASPTVD